MREHLGTGGPFPDLELPDHTGSLRRLSELAAGDPLFLNFYRGFWWPKEQAFYRGLVRLQDEAEVTYTRFVSVSIDPPEVAAAFRASLDARWTFLSDAERRYQAELGLRETTTPCSAPTCRLVPAVPRPLDPPGLERLLVLGPADQRGAPAGLPGGDPDDPPRLGGSRQMSWCWVAFLAEPPTGDELAGAVASATATDLDGRPAGLVAAWRRGRKPLRSAGRVDERVIDPAGPPAWVSLVLVPPEVAAVRRPREAAICLHKTGRALGLPGRWRRLAAGSPEPALSHYWAEDRCGRRGGVA